MDCPRRSEATTESVGLGSLSQLAIWWIKLGIIPERIEPGHPEQNGRLERLHRTLKAETASPPQANGRRQQRAFDTFRHSYNDERPHEALGQSRPRDRYSPSFRSYPSRVSAPDYEVGVTVRKVRTNGEIKWRGNKIYLSEALRGEPVGLSPKDDRYWIIRYGPLAIGLLDDHTLSVPAVGLPSPESSPIEGEELSSWPRGHVMRRTLKPSPTFAPLARVTWQPLAPNEPEPHRKAMPIRYGHRLSVDIRPSLTGAGFGCNA